VIEDSLQPERRQIPVTDPDSFWMSTDDFRNGASAPVASAGSFASPKMVLLRRARNERQEVAGLDVDENAAEQPRRFPSARP
jgi:hypothetical protein